MPQVPMDPDQHQHLQQAARDHLWMHFTRMSTYQTHEVPVIVRGEGAYIYDAQGRRYLDGLAGLFVNQLGHGMDLVAAKLEIGCEVELTSDGGHAGFSCSLSSYISNPLDPQPAITKARTARSTPSVRM